MSFLPSRDGIIDELLVVSALAQNAFVTPHNFTALPYLQHLINDRSKQAIIERLLAIAIKTRFLDDRTKLLDRDRRLNLIGRYTEDKAECADKISIRTALNKLVHHDKIEIVVASWSAIVVATENSPENTKLIQPGPHRGKRVIISLEGTDQSKKKPWAFDIDLYKLIDEMLRVLDFESQQ